MQWYYRIVNRILSGLIFFLLPVVVLFIILRQAIILIRKLILPLKNYLPAEPVLGIGVITLISFVIILLICYLAGLLYRQKAVKSLITKIEDNVLVYIPGYTMLKSTASDAVIETDDNLQSVLVDEGDGSYRPGIEVDRQLNGYSTIFFPGPPLAKSGFLKVIPASKVKKLDISVVDLIKIVRGYGKGSALFFSEELKLEEIDPT
jgi:uncharacterized membrane protein